MPPPEPTIANYDERTASEIKQRLRKLSQDDLGKLEAYEKQGQARSTVLEAIAALRGDQPWPGYDDMEVEEINDALKQRDGDTASQVLEYERRHKARSTVIEFAKRRQETGEESAGSAPGGERKSSTATRSESESGAQRKRPATSRSSASSRRGSRSSARSGSTSSASRSAGGRSAQASQSRTRAKRSSRPSASRSSRSQASKRSRSTRPRSRSSGAIQSPADAREAARAEIRQRATRALKSGAGRRKIVAKSAPRAGRSKAKDARRAVGSKARDSRDAVGTAVKGSGHAVQAAAGKAKTPAVVAAAGLAGVGGGLALRRAPDVKLRKRKRVLGLPTPKRTAFGKAAKQMSKAVDSASSAGRLSGWSDGLQELRQKFADGNAPAAKLSGGKSPVSKLTSKLSTHKIGAGKSAIGG
jgi:hypothetical protein